MLGIALSLPFVQTKIGNYVTEMLNADYKTDIKVERVAISIFGGVKLKNVRIKDYRHQTMIFASVIKTNILSFKKLYEGDLLFGEIRVDGLYFNLKTYKGENDSNIDKFVALFDSDKPSTKRFLMKAKNVYLSNSHFLLIDENRENPKDLDITKLNAELSNFKIYGPDVTTNILKMSCLDHRGLYVKNLTTNFTYTLKHIKLDHLVLKTNESLVKGNLIMNYGNHDFSKFNDKVQFDVKLEKASISSNDLFPFYKELGKNQIFKFTSKIKGTLNDLYVKDLNLRDQNNSKIIGDVNFKNLFGEEGQEFYMKGSFDQIVSNYKNLTSILPTILGKSLPPSLKKLGQFNFRGKTEVTTKTLKANFYASTALGNIQSDLVMTNLDHIDNAFYKGNVILEQFNVGAFIGQKELGVVTLNLDVNGKGFNEKYLNTSFSGDVYKIRFKGYNYTNIVVDGNFKKPFFKGKVFVNDPNLFLDFVGNVNIGKKECDYDFSAKIDYANLTKLKLTKSDSLAILKGAIDIKVTGTTIDNLRGNIAITNASYQNNKTTYLFDNFAMKSSFDSKNVRTIAINSPDIIEGQVVGKFQIAQLQKIAENSLGSLYSNYRANPVKKGQFLKFNFSIHNKIIEILSPDFSIGDDTSIKGSINSDNNEFKFKFSSPKIAAFENYFDKINIEIDNKNPLFNTFIEMDSIKTKYYKVSNFNMINVTKNDTLFLRSEFKGGNKAEDFFKLNLYHTIDKNNHNVVGLQKSDIKFKDYFWFLNEEENEQNKIVFDKSLNDFSFEDIILSHENQKISLNGLLKGKNYKDLEIGFNDVNLNKITPDIPSLKVNGKLNGTLSFKQMDEIFQPKTSLVVDSLNINDIHLGRLNLDVKGDQGLKNFELNSSIENKDVDIFNAIGAINIIDDKTIMDVDLRFNNFNLGSLSLLGEDIITDIKGFASGNARIEGDIKAPEINGRLYLDEVALKVPYLNVNYQFENKTVVDVTENLFIVRNAILKDTKFDTQGVLEGRISHTNFSDWDLDLHIKSDRLLALDTKDSEDAAYFGTAFINGKASITGPTDGLFIKVNAKSEKGTAIKIPINDADAVGTNDYIHFLSPKEKNNLGSGIVDKTRNYNGLELEFNLDIDKNAEIEVILNRSSGHGMRGRGVGGLLLEINTLGKFNMIGDIQVYEGSYNFKYGGIIDKKFEVKKLGSIVWEGDPMRARLDLEAVYKTMANPSVLLENPTFNKKVPVEVVIGIKGNLNNPEPDFKISFPTVSSVMKSEIQFKLDDKDIRQTQALYLLSTGGFLSAEGVGQSDLSVNLFETASGIFNNIFQDEDGKFNLGLDYVSADKRPGLEADGRFGVTVSTKINERIIINGKVGVPVGGINESAIVGNVEVLYRVNEDGTLNLRMFNKENDVSYIGQGIGYTQGVGVSYEVNFDTFKELVNKIFKKKVLEREVKSNNEFDSDVESEYQNSDSKKSRKATRTNNEGVKEEEEELLVD